MLKSYLSRLAAVPARWYAFVGVLVTGLLYAAPAGATGEPIINLEGVTKSIEEEIKANLATIEVVFGILLAIGVLFRLYRRFVN
jgi:hypothetical protein